MKSFKSQMDFMGLDFEADESKMIVELRVMMSEL